MKLDRSMCHYAGLAVFMMGALVWRLKALPLYPFMEDELISISVMRSIVETGQPLTEKGLIYWRAVFVHYLMSIPLLWMEVSEVSTRIVNAVLSVIMLPAAWILARRLSGPIAGWGAVVFLAFSSYQALYASMARFYMPFELFFLVVCLLAGEYFVAKKGKVGPWLVFATAGLFMIHHLALQGFLVLAIAIIVGGWDSSWWKRKSVIVSVFLLLLVVWFADFWAPASRHSGSMALPLLIGGIDDHWAFFNTFNARVPFGTIILLLGAIPAYTTGNKYWKYCHTTWILAMVSLSVLSPDEAPRYMAHLFPLGVVLVFCTIIWFLMLPWRKEDLIRLKKRNNIVFSLLVLVLAGGYFVQSPPHLPGFEGVVGNSWQYINQRPAHEYIKQRIRPGEIVVSTAPSLTKLYLAKGADHWLRENYNDVDGSYSPFPEDKKKNAPEFYIDSPDRVRELLASTRQGIWLYASWKIVWSISKETDRLIRENFIAKFSYQRTYVLYRPPVRSK